MKHHSLLLTALAVSIGLFSGPTQLQTRDQLSFPNKELQSIELNETIESFDSLSCLNSTPLDTVYPSLDSAASLLSGSRKEMGAFFTRKSTFPEISTDSLNFEKDPAKASSKASLLPVATLEKLLSSSNVFESDFKHNGKKDFLASKHADKIPSIIPNTGSFFTTTASVNFRQGPSTTNSVIKKLASGSKVDLISKTNSTWYKVRFNGTVGYVSSKYLKSVPLASTPSTSSTYKTTASINFRSGPSTSYSIIRNLPKGTSVTLISKYSSSWYKVSHNGTIGYLSPKYLNLSDDGGSSTSIPVHSIGFKGGLHKKITDLRPYLDPSWNGHNYMNGPDLQPFLDKGLLVTWGPALYNYDNKTTMILGHGSGVFNYMINIKVGSLVTISDLNGKVRTYKITDVKSNPTKSIYLKYNNGVSLADIYTHGGKEEAISLQMCQKSVNTHYYGVPID